MKKTHPYVKIAFLSFALLSQAGCVSNNYPWSHVDYAELECGTPEAILSTTGCITNSNKALPANNKAVSDANDVGKTTTPNTANILSEKGRR